MNTPTVRRLLAIAVMGAVVTFICVASPDVFELLSTPGVLLATPASIVFSLCVFYVATILVRHEWQVYKRNEISLALVSFNLGGIVGAAVSVAHLLVTSTVEFVHVILLVVPLLWFAALLVGGFGFLCGGVLGLLVGWVCDRRMRIGKVVQLGCRNHPAAVSTIK